MLTSPASETSTDKTSELLGKASRAPKENTGSASDITSATDGLPNKRNDSFPNGNLEHNGTSHEVPSPHQQTDTSEMEYEKISDYNNMSMSDRIGTAWELLNGLSISILMSFVHDICKWKGKEETKVIIKNLNNILSEKNNSSHDTTSNSKNKRRYPKNNHEHHANKCNEPTTSNQNSTRGKREVNNLYKDLNYWKNGSRSFDSATTQRLRPRATSVYVNKLNDLSFDSKLKESTSENEYSVLGNEPEMPPAENTEPICRIENVKSLNLQTAEKEDPEVKKSSESHLTAARSVLLDAIIGETMKPIDDHENHTDDTSFQIQGTQPSPNFSSEPEVKPSNYDNIFHHVNTIFKVTTHTTGSREHLEENLSTESENPKSEKRKTTKRKIYENKSGSQKRARYNNDKGNRRNEINKGDNGDNIQLKCNYCPEKDYVFSSQNTLYYHLFRHYNLKRITCTLCNETMCYDLSKLQDHQSKLHKGSKDILVNTKLPSYPPLLMNIDVPKRKKRKSMPYYQWKPKGSRGA